MARPGRGHSLGWVCAWDGEVLFGFVSVDLREFYFEACGFEPTNAGLIALS